MRFLLFCFLLIAFPLSAGELALNVHGLSYHPDREDSAGKKFNELNAGLGIHYLFRSTEKSLWSIESGVYLNSFADPAAYGAISYQYRFTQHWSAGVAGSFFYSKSYHNGHPFIAPFPVLTFRERDVAFTLIHFPRVKKINPVSVFGIYATLYVF